MSSGNGDNQPINQSIRTVINISFFFLSSSGLFSFKGKLDISNSKKKLCYNVKLFYIKLYIYYLIFQFSESLEPNELEAVVMDNFF